MTDLAKFSLDMTTTKKQKGLIKASEQWVAHSEQRINKIIEQNFIASFMSNAKWRKLLALLAEHAHLTIRLNWKIVDEEKLFESPAISTDELDEKNLKDGRNQPFIYKEIEWLEVVTNHTREITDELLKRGQFPLAESKLGFRVIGYSKANNLTDQS